DCMYKVIPGHHLIGAIGLCDESGIKVICRTCNTDDFWETPKDFFDRPGFLDILDDLIQLHASEKLYFNQVTGDDEEPEVVRVPLWQRARWAVEVLRTKYVQMDED